MSKQDFCVEVTQSTRHKFIVEANSPEEAIGIAESYLEDGEEGDVVEAIIEESDAYPCEEGECA
jgi:hypothetical protein